MAKRLILTGGTGLIGKESLQYLSEEGFDVYSLTTRDIADERIHWLKCDLFDENAVKKIFDEIKPEYFLNFAWITGGDYLTNEKNLLFKDIGIKMLKFFKENGGKRAVYAGTCFEYDLNGDILTENSKLNPKTLYANCKNELHTECELFVKENSLSFGWGRIFYVFGHNENPSRLTAKLINSLKENKTFELAAPNNKLDYMYTKDIAHAFVKFLESDYNGSVNICTGNGILLKDYANMIQNIMGKKDLVKFDPDKPSSLDVIGANKILTDIIGFRPQYTIEQGLKEVAERI